MATNATEDKPEYKGPPPPGSLSHPMNPIGNMNDEENAPKAKHDSMDKVKKAVENLSSRGRHFWQDMRNNVYQYATSKNQGEFDPLHYHSVLKSTPFWPDASEFTKEEVAAVYKGVAQKTLEDMSKYMKFNPDISPRDVPEGWGKDADKWLRSFLNNHLTNTSQDYGLNSYSLKGMPTPEQLEEAEEIFEVWKAEHERNAGRSSKIDEDKYEKGIRRLVHIRHPKPR